MLNKPEGLVGKMSTVVNSGVSFGIRVFQQSSGLGETAGPGVYFKTMSVHR